MNAYRKLTIIALAVTVLAVLTPTAQAQMLEEKMQVTFSGPVEVPGEVLPAGTYTFQALVNGHMTRILSADEKHIFATLSTIPEELREPAGKATIIMGESAKGSPEKVEAWFYPGDSIGNQFMYPKARSGKDIASITGSVARETGHIAAETARGLAVSSEFLGVQARNVAVESGNAIVHAVKFLVS